MHPHRLAGQPQHQPLATGLQRGAAGFQRRLSGRLQRDDFRPQGHLAGRDARHVEQVVNQPHHLRQLPGHHRTHAGCCGPGTGPGTGLTFLFQDLQPAAQRGQRVAQFVGQRGQEFVLAAFGVAQSLLGAPLLADVLHQRQHVHDAAADGAFGHQTPDVRAGLAVLLEAAFEAAGPGAVEHPVQRRCPAFTQRLRQVQRLQAAAQQGVWRLAGGAFDGGVDEHQLVRTVETRQHVGCVVGEGAQLAFALFQPSLRLLELGDVDEGGHRAAHRALVVVQGHGTTVQVAHSAVVEDQTQLAGRHWLAGARRALQRQALRVGRHAAPEFAKGPQALRRRRGGCRGVAVRRHADKAVGLRVAADARAGAVVGEPDEGRHAAHQRFQFPGPFAGLLFGSLQRGVVLPVARDVLEVHRQPAAGARVAAQVEMALHVVEVELEDPHLAGGRAKVLGLQRCAHGVGESFPVRAAQQVGSRPAHQTFSRRVEVDEAPVAVEGREAVGDAFQRGLQLARGQRAGGHVVPFDEDAGDAPGFVARGFVDEVQVTQHGLSAVGRCQLQGRALGHVGHPAAVDLVEQRDEALFGHLGHAVLHRAARHGALARQLGIAAVAVAVAVFGALQHADEARCLVEQRHPALLVRQALGGQHLLGGLGAQHQHAADAARRRVVVHRAVAVGPVDAVQPAVAGDGDQLVLMPGGGAAGHHAVDLRADDRPDLAPGPLRRRAQHGRVGLGPQRTAVGVVVETDVLRAPEQEHWVVGAEQDAQGGAQRRGPAFYRPQWRGHPVVRAHEPAHRAATGEEGWCRRALRAGRVHRLFSLGTPPAWPAEYKKSNAVRKCAAISSHPR